MTLLLTTPFLTDVLPQTMKEEQAIPTRKVKNVSAVAEPVTLTCAILKYMKTGYLYETVAENT